MFAVSFYGGLGLKEYFLSNEFSENFKEAIAPADRAMRARIVQYVPLLHNIPPVCAKKPCLLQIIWGTEFPVESKKRGRREDCSASKEDGSR